VPRVDGRYLSFNYAIKRIKPAYVGTVAKENPWEVLHKIRWGHPTAMMISLNFLTPEEQNDVLAFCQTLPEK
jgi:thiosulfate dehydrogenase